jgi:hypothetical protein
MTKKQSRSLMRRLGELESAPAHLPSASGRRPEKPAKMKGRKLGPVGAFLRPLGISFALLLAAYGLVSLGTTFWRSYQRHHDYTTAVHQDRSVFDVFVRRSLPEDSVDLVVRDFDGKLRRVAAAKSETDRFVNETILMLYEERDRIKKDASADIDHLFDYAFADREQALEAHADWFFEWKRSYVILKETLTSAAARFVQSGQYERLSEAVERDVKDYFMRHYEAQVLKPKVRDRRITQGLETLARRSHDNYRRVIANGDMRLQLFLAKNTQHLEDVPADTKMTGVNLDWDAQKWKAPTYLMEDRAFDGIAGLGVAAGSGTVGALVLGPVMNRVMARTFGVLSRRFVTTFGARLALAEQGAVAGTLVQPAGGQVVGAIAGVLVGVAADYFINEAQKGFNRDKFVEANREALDATVDAWKSKLRGNVHAAIDRWFDDARSAVILARD